jgi:hypothetical protein
MADRLGRVLHWACSSLAVGWVLFFGILSAIGFGGVTEMVAGVTREPFAFLIWFGLPPLVLYGIGRAFRYVLSKE